jgi:hypothetical protein
MTPSYSICNILKCVLHKVTDATYRDSVYANVNDLYVLLEKERIQRKLKNTVSFINRFAHTQNKHSVLILKVPLRITDVGLFSFSYRLLACWNSPPYYLQ